MCGVQIEKRAASLLYSDLNISAVQRRNAGQLDQIGCDELLGNDVVGQNFGQRRNISQQRSSSHVV